MAQTDNKTSLSSEEKRSLAESARLCEMIVEANPSDTGALETLKEIMKKKDEGVRLAVKTVQGGSETRRQMIRM